MSQDLNQTLYLLRDPTHPLVVKMKRKAPWTYYHSLILGEVASHACLLFKHANPFLALIWARFHDIGKLIDPFAYAENQEDGNYPFMPEVIKTHIKMGVELASHFNLPNEIIRFIITHHWTGIAPNDTWEMEQYELAEKPISVEETLVMLADSCEAAIRWFKWDYSKENIRTMVQRVFLDKEQKDQLRSSLLITTDFRQVEDNFVEDFYYVYHRRYATETKN